MKNKTFLQNTSRAVNTYVSINTIREVKVNFSTAIHNNELEFLRRDVSVTGFFFKGHDHIYSSRPIGFARTTIESKWPLKAVWTIIKTFLHDKIACWYLFRTINVFTKTLARRKVWRNKRIFRSNPTDDSIKSTKFTTIAQSVFWVYFRTRNFNFTAFFFFFKGNKET